MTIPNDWVDATPSGTWQLDEERDRASVKFTVGSDSIWWNGSLKSDKSIEFCREQLKKLGWNGAMESRDLSPTPVRIKIEEETYNGQTRQAVKAISAKGSSAQKPPKDPVKARSLMSKLSGAAAPSGADPFANAPAPADEQPYDDSDGGDTSFP